MKRLVKTIILGLLLCSSVFARNTDSLRYYEPLDDGSYRFYFDDRYFLTDRDCQFVAIERDAGYNAATRSFDGPFVDYDTSHRVLLTGNYIDGKKSGLFQAFHTTGHLKWQVRYENDMPTGTWSYCYPDGRPLYVVEYGNDGFFIRDFWDTRGRHRVSNGKGRLEVTLKLYRYQEHGYPFVRRRGRVANGKPHGTWSTQFIADKGASMDGGFEYFSRGRFVRGLNTYTEEWYSDSARLPFLPVEPFIRAELLVGIPCSIDAYSGFLTYLKEHMENYFIGFGQNLEPQRIEYHIELDKSGSPNKVSVVKSLPSETLENELTQALNDVPFWYPSYADGDYVNDTLVIQADVLADTKEQKLRFFDVTITRQKGL